MKQTFAIKFTVNLDEKKLRLIHGDAWLNGFKAECQEFVKDLNEFISRHPFVEASMIVDGKEINPAAVIAQRITQDRNRSSGS